MERNGQNTFITEDSHHDIIITSGRLLPANTPVPFEFIMEIDEEEEDYSLDEIDDDGEEEELEDYDYEDKEDGDEDEEDITFQKPNMFAYYSNVSLMNKAMIDILESCGVDTIQTFPAVIRHPETNYENKDYFFVNILDRISCANIEESDTIALGNSYYFNELVINPDQIDNLSIFRLNEYS